MCFTTVLPFGIQMTGKMVKFPNEHKQLQKCILKCNLLDYIVLSNSTYIRNVKSKTVKCFGWLHLSIYSKSSSLFVWYLQDTCLSWLSLPLKESAISMHLRFIKLSEWCYYPKRRKKNKRNLYSSLSLSLFLSHCLRSLICLNCIQN